MGAAGVANAMLGVSGGPKCPPTFRWICTRDRRAVAGALRAIAETPGLVRLIPSHGDVVADGAAQVLRGVVARDLER